MIPDSFRPQMFLIILNLKWILLFDSYGKAIRGRASYRGGQIGVEYAEAFEIDYTMNKKIVTLHQPEFMPWCGFFYKIINLLYLMMFNLKKIILVIEIKSDIGWQYINIPVQISGNSKLNFNWQKKLLKAIYFSYQKSKFFDEIYSLIEKSINLIDINIKLIKEIFKYRCSYIITIRFKYYN